MRALILAAVLVTALITTLLASGAIAASREQVILAGGGNLVAASYNCPARYDPGRRADLQKLADMGAMLIAVQEVQDRHAKAIAPDGWRAYRPEKARSAAVLYDPAAVKIIERGHYRVNQPGTVTRRIVWVLAESQATGQQARFGSVHLPAFKTRSDANAEAFRYAEERAARWLQRDALNVLVGDLNASENKRWMPNLLRVGVFERPAVVTFPRHGSLIDHAVRPKGQLRAQVLATLDGASDHHALIFRLPY
jgi:endonuclease/exonuclease/phosphatase family metal-dependent hydrolase